MVWVLMVLDGGEGVGVVRYRVTYGLVDMVIVFTAAGFAAGGRGRRFFGGGVLDWIGLRCLFGPLSHIFHQLIVLNLWFWSLLEPFRQNSLRTHSLLGLLWIRNTALRGFGALFYLGEAETMLLPLEILSQNRAHTAQIANLLHRITPQIPPHPNYFYWDILYALGS